MVKLAVKKKWRGCCAAETVGAGCADAPGGGLDWAGGTPMGCVGRAVPHAAWCRACTRSTSEEAGLGASLFQACQLSRAGPCVSNAIRSAVAARALAAGVATPSCMRVAWLNRPGEGWAGR